MCIPSGQRPARYSIAAKYEVAKRIAEIEAALPFAILGFDTDNAGEFLNWHLVNYFARRRSPVGFTRSRAYREKQQRARRAEELDPRASVGGLRKAGGSASRRVA